MSAGANDLTTLAIAKEYLRLTNANDDTLLQRLVTNVSAFIEDYCNRIFASAAYTETRDGISCLARKMAFANYPVTAVTSVYINGYQVPASPDFFTAGYRFNANFLVLNGYAFGEGFQNIVLNYTAGYPATPSDIVLAATQLVAQRYRELERIGQISKSQQGENITYITDAIPKSIEAALKPWRKVILV